MKSKDHKDTTEKTDPSVEHDHAGLGSKAGDILKKAITVGIGAAFLTEESIRALVGELKLPKELVTNLLSQANSTRSEFLGKFSSEMLEKIQSRINPTELVNEVLRKNDIEFTVKVKVTPKKGPNSDAE
jgi:hypothetical protein